MSDRVMTFAGALSGPQARGLLAFAGVPWNKVPANLAGAGKALGVRDADAGAFSSECAPPGARGAGPNARGVVQNISNDLSSFLVDYYSTQSGTVTRAGGGRDFQVLGFEKDYAPLRSGGVPVLYVRTADTRCGEEVLFVPRVAVIGGLVTQAEVDRAAAAMSKTPEQLGIIRARLVAQPALTAAAHERARRNGDLLDCIAQALGLPGSSAEWKCPSGFSQWFWALYATPLGKAVVWGGAILVGLAVVPPMVRLVRR